MCVRERRGGIQEVRLQVATCLFAEAAEAPNHLLFVSNGTSLC